MKSRSAISLGGIVAVLLTAGCGSGQPEASPPSGSALVVSSSSAAPSSAPAALSLERMRAQPLRAQSFARLGPDAAIAPTAEEARRATEALRARSRGDTSAPVVRIIEDQGEAVKVATDLEQNPSLSVDEFDDLQGVVMKSTLLPVLRVAEDRSQADGTGYHLQPGMALTVAGPDLVPADPLVAAILPAVPVDDVAFSFEPEPAPAKDAGASDGPARHAPSLGCEWGKVDDLEKMRAADREKVRQKAEAAGAAGGWQFNGFTADCALTGEGPALVYAGHPLPPKAARFNACSMHPVEAVATSAPEQALVKVYREMAAIWVLADRARLESSGGCGRGYLGQPEFRHVATDAPIFFRDGSPAGKVRHRGNFTFRGPVTEAEGRACRELAFVAGGLCYRKEDVPVVGPHRP